MYCLRLFQLLCLLHCSIASKPRIVGGQQTRIEQLPYLVYLRQRGSFICGGSLISPSCVLSAAHCVYAAQPQDYTVHAGASRLDEEAAVVRAVAAFHISAQYAPTNFDMDVAILQLAEQVPLGRISTIATCHSPPAANAYVRISGWGVTHEGAPDPAAQVRSTLVRVLSHSECQLAYAGQAQLSDSMLCAAIRGLRDSCSGDSGGPLVYRGQLCGIVSWGFGCARVAYPGVYTSMASRRVQSFIEQTLAKVKSR